MDKLFVSVTEACRLIGIGRSTMYKLIGKGDVETVKIGTRRLIKVTSLTALIEIPSP